MSAWDYIKTKVDLKAMESYKIYDTKDGVGVGYSDLDDDVGKAFLCGMIYAIGLMEDYDHEVRDCPESMLPVKELVEQIRRTAIDDAADCVDCWALSALNDILYGQANEANNEKEEE